MSLELLYPTNTVTEEQARDIAFMLTHLNVMDAALNGRDTGRQWGEGFRATLDSPILVKTDADQTHEPLGWLVLSEWGWVFTQTPPEEYRRNLADHYQLPTNS